MPQTADDSVADTIARAKARTAAIVGPRRTPYEHEVSLWIDGWTQGVDHAIKSIGAEPANESVSTD